MQFIRKHILVCLFLLGILVYLPSLPNSFVWDDEQFITSNTLVQHLSAFPTYFATNTTAGSGQSSNYYRPVTTLLFALDFAVWGLHPFFFHLTNALLHAFSGVLVFAVLQIILKRYKLSTQSTLVACIVAVFFLIHPAQVEAVVYANSRGDSLSAVFGLLMMLFYLKLPHVPTGNKKLLYACTTIIFFIFALLSKESAIAWIGVPFILLMLSRLHHDRVARSQLLTAIIGLLGAILYMGLRLTVLNFTSANQLQWEPSYQTSVLVRLTTFFLHVVPNYLLVLFLPLKLHMERMVPIITKPSDVSLLFFVIFLMFILISVLLSIRRFGLVLFSLGWMFLFLAPISGIIPVNGLFYEHWLYVPMIGFWTLLVVLAHIYLKKRIVLIGCAILSIFWIGLSIRQMVIWRDPITLYTYTLQFSDTARLHNNLGMAYAEKNELEKAIDQYQKAIALSDAYPQTHHNLGNLYKQTGDTQQAIKEYQKALTLDPNFIFSINALLSLYLEKKQYAEALNLTKYAEQRFPQNQIYIQLATQLTATSSAVKP